MRPGIMEPNFVCRGGTGQVRPWCAGRLPDVLSATEDKVVIHQSHTAPGAERLAANWNVVRILETLLASKTTERRAVSSRQLILGRPSTQSGEGIPSTLDASKVQSADTD